MDAHVEAHVGRIPFSGRYHTEPRKIVDDYILTSESVGAGANGTVRVIKSRSDPSQRFALKSFDLDHYDDLEEIETETKNYLCMDHPHIARLYDVYETKQHIHLVMECVEGGDLFEKLHDKGSCFSEDESSKMLMQLLSAVNYMHKNGVVHRDIKMENIVFDQYGCLKLIDFGLSAMLDPSSSDRLRRCCGTVEYCAPEVFRKWYTSQCDLWSVGVVGFILLSGKMPFYGSDSNQVRKISEGSYSMTGRAWREVSEDAKSFIRLLLQVDPSKRLSAADALEHPWISRSRVQLSEGVLDAVTSLASFFELSNFQRHCMQMCAWSLSNEDQAQVRSCFTTLDKNHQGVLKINDLKRIAIDQLSAKFEPTLAKALGILERNQDQDISYSDFLAAMLGTKLHLDEHIVTCAYRRIALHGLGVVTKKSLRDVFGYSDCDKLDASIDELTDTEMAIYPIPV
eukprot:CAMPEP_0169143950 /NCGR_PEP_ID=MMETSP1015-20121227/45923_1 /TAXON_ID=342587 /ORGANISM="Karlodinium micrum, Strain CCMP2283" /LENGTH=454 /DNA_ID=CAMNT_0009211051 /DNA_START=72 /DNA_END=1437 /DNA_ORIENTATION=+